MSCKHAGKHRSKNFKEEVPVCRKNKTYCKKVKFIEPKGQERIKYVMEESHCDIENK